MSVCVYVCVSVSLHALYFYDENIYLITNLGYEGVTHKACLGKE